MDCQYLVDIWLDFLNRKRVQILNGLGYILVSDLIKKLFVVYVQVIIAV